MTNAFKDKVVQHSLCDNILEPAFSKVFIRDNYASQSGRGTHDGLYRAGAAGRGIAAARPGGSAALFGRLGFEMRHIEVFLFNPA